MPGIFRSFLRTVSGTAATALLFGALGAGAASADPLKLKIGTEPSFAPFEYTDAKTGKLEGFDIEFMEALGRVSGFEVEWVPLPFDSILPAVISGSLDAAISGFVMNEERKKRVDFSEPYYMAGQSIMITKAQTGEIRTREDLKGKKLCVQIGSVGAQVAAKVEDAELMTFNTTAEAYMELDKRGCDAMISATSVHQYYLVQSGNHNLVMLPDIIDAAGVGIVMPKNNPEVKKLINEGFAKLRADGTYQKIYDKWFTLKD